MVKKKAKKKRTKRPAMLAMQMVGGGQLSRIPVPKRRRQLLFAVYGFRGGAMVEIQALPKDPYDAGHSLFKLMEALATVYANASGSSYGEAVAMILDAVISHAESEIQQLVASLPPSVGAERPSDKKVH